MSNRGKNKPSLLTIYAPGITKWLRDIVQENRVLMTLTVVFTLCIGLYVANDELLASSSLAYRVITDVITAVLIATTVGLFYELSARTSVIAETVRFVQQELDSRLGSTDCGLIGFWEAHNYFHEDIAKHLSTVKEMKVMAIHGTRIWANLSIMRAIVDGSSVQLDVMLLDPRSPLVQTRVDQYPEAYDADVIRGQIRAQMQLLHNWQMRTGRIRLKLYDYPPSFWVVVVDDVLYVSVYGDGKLSQEAAVYKFDNRRNSLYHFFYEYFNHLWGSAMNASELTEPDI